MARIWQVNQRARETLGKEKQFQHAMANQRIKDLLFARFGFDVWQMPVCEGCEGYAFWGKDEFGQPVGHCLHCGKITKHPLTVEQYYQQGCHLDRTLHPSAPQYVDRERIDDPRRIATVWGGEAEMNDVHQKIIIARS